jgi:hypothetical protein
MAESIARAPPVLKRQKSQSNNHQSVPADVYAVAGDKAKPFLSRQPSLPKMPIASLVRNKRERSVCNINSGFAPSLGSLGSLVLSLSRHSYPSPAVPLLSVPWISHTSTH